MFFSLFKTSVTTEAESSTSITDIFIGQIKDNKTQCSRFKYVFKVMLNILFECCVTSTTENLEMYQIGKVDKSRKLG